MIMSCIVPEEEGLDRLVYQAALASRLWTDKELEVKSLRVVKYGNDDILSGL